MHAHLSTLNAIVIFRSPGIANECITYLFGVALLSMDYSQGILSMKHLFVHSWNWISWIYSEQLSYHTEKTKVTVSALFLTDDIWATRPPSVLILLLWQEIGAICDFQLEEITMGSMISDSVRLKAFSLSAVRGADHVVDTVQYMWRWWCVCMCTVIYHYTVKGNSTQNGQFNSHQESYTVKMATF